MNVSEEAVEVAAKSRWETEWEHDDDMPPWNELSETVRSNMRRKARKDLEAAAPIIQASAWAEGAKAQADAYGMDVDAGSNPYEEVSNVGR